MKAIRYHEFGDPDVLRYEDVDRPVPGPEEVLIRVAATSFNGVDAGIRGGNLREPFPVTLPHTPGIDVAGTIAELGENVDNFRVGDKVVGFLSMVADGASAEYVVAPANILTSAPASIPLADAAAFPLVGMTAWQALFEVGQLSAGQRVLVNGAGGAVGGYAVQLAKHAEAYVIATASPRSSDRVRRAGADDVIDHTATDVTSTLTDPVDMVLNLAPIDPPQLAALVTRVRPGGIVVNTTVWMTAPGDEERRVRGVNVYVHSDAEQLAHLVGMVDRGDLFVDVSERVSLPDLPTVHARAATGDLSGKIVVVPAVS